MKYLMTLLPAAGVGGWVGGWVRDLLDRLKVFTKPNHCELAKFRKK